MSLEAAAITIRALLFADVCANLLRLETHRGHCVSTGAEVLAREIPLFATQAGHRYGAFPFQKSDHRGHRILRRNRDAHVHMVRQQVSLNDLAPLLPRQRVKYFSPLAACLAKQHLAPPLGHKHHMILTVPTGMRYPLIRFRHNILLFLALTKPRGMLRRNATVKPFLVSLVEPVAYLKSELSAGCYPAVSRLRVNVR